jgi:hypothetical protein
MSASSAWSLDESSVPYMYGEISGGGPAPLVIPVVVEEERLLDKLPQY